MSTLPQLEQHGPRRTTQDGPRLGPDRNRNPGERSVDCDDDLGTLAQAAGQSPACPRGHIPPAPSRAHLYCAKEIGWTQAGALRADPTSWSASRQPESLLSSHQSRASRRTLTLEPSQHEPNHGVDDIVEAFPVRRVLPVHDLPRQVHNHALEALHHAPGIHATKRTFLLPGLNV